MKIVKNGPFRVRLSAEKETRRERLISKAQKPQNNFLKKNLKFLIFSFRKCRIVFWALLTYILLQNIKKLERGTLLKQ